MKGSLTLHDIQFRKTHLLVPLAAECARVDPQLAVAASLGSIPEGLGGTAMPLTCDGLSKLAGDVWYSSDKNRVRLGFLAGHSLRQESPMMMATTWRIVSRAN